MNGIYEVDLRLSYEFDDGIKDGGPTSIHVLAPDAEAAIAKAKTEEEDGASFDAEPDDDDPDNKPYIKHVSITGVRQLAAYDCVADVDE